MRASTLLNVLQFSELASAPFFNRGVGKQDAVVIVSDGLGQDKEPKQGFLKPVLILWSGNIPIKPFDPFDGSAQGVDLTAALLWVALAIVLYTLGQRL